MTCLDYYHQVGDNIKQKQLSYKYEVIFKGPYQINQKWENGAVNFKMGLISDRVNIN